MAYSQQGHASGKSVHICVRSSMHLCWAGMYTHLCMHVYASLPLVQPSCSLPSPAEPQRLGPHVECPWMLSYEASTLNFNHELYHITICSMSKSSLSCHILLPCHLHWSQLYHSPVVSMLPSNCGMEREGWKSQIYTHAWLTSNLKTSYFVLSGNWICWQNGSCQPWLASISLEQRSGSISKIILYLSSAHE